MAKKIMIVDDSRIIQLQLQKILADTDYDVVACCQNGEDALKMYEEVNPDLVTMDILMPGMDGLQAAKILLQEHPEARVIMISSLAYDDTLNEAGNLGVKGFVYKPFDKDQIMESFEKAFSDVL